MLQSIFHFIHTGYSYWSRAFMISFQSVLYSKDCYKKQRNSHASMSAESDVIDRINILSIILIKGSQRPLVELWFYYVIFNKNLNGSISLFFVKLWYTLSYWLHFQSIRLRLFAAYLCDKNSNLIGIFC